MRSVSPTECALWQNQRALELATKRTKPLEWIGIGVNSLKEADETILNISRCSSKLARSTNDADGGRAGVPSYTVRARRKSEHP